jgi:hypothetical protein
MLRAGRGLAGPLLIVGVVLFALRDFAFRGRVTTADALSLFLPTYCHLGRSLAAGHIPAWNPYTFGGAPFAADPQSGWMNLPAMLLFTLLPCTAAIGWFLVLQPILAGLGLYWFVRSEGGSPVAATSGGLVIALAMSSSGLTVSPFGATLAWTAVVLAALSRYFHTTTWASRVVWALLTAVAWGQLAAAHFGIGLVMGSGVLVAYGVAALVTKNRRSSWGGRDAFVIVALLISVLFLVNLAYLLPRLHYLPRTSLYLGYQRLRELNGRFAGVPPGPRVAPTAVPQWPLNLSASSGAHVAALALALSFAGWWSKKRRPLVVALSVIGGLYYLLTLNLVASRVPPSISSWRPVDHYLNSPQRFAYELILVIAVLAAIGVEAWQENSSALRRLAMAAPGILIWGLLPLLEGAPPHMLALLGWGALVGAIVLVGVARRPVLALLIPVVVAAEMVANAVGNPKTESRALLSQPFRPRPAQLWAISHSTVRSGVYVRPGPIARAIEDAHSGRYLTLTDIRTQDRAQRSAGNVFLNQALLYRIENVGGYNSIQPLRYWMFVRAAQNEGQDYQLAMFDKPSPLIYDLLDVDFVIAPTDQLPPGTEPVVREGPWALYRQQVPPVRAVVVPMWIEMKDANAALAAVLSPLFDPDREVILEGGRQGATASNAGSAGQATYTSLGDQRARVIVTTPGPAVVLVKNGYDPGWHATLDGRPVRVEPGDYAFQAVRVPAGRHTIVLSYDDPWIGLGVLGSALVVIAMLGASFVLRRRTPTTTRGASNTASATAEPNSP